LIPPLLAAALALVPAASHSSVSVAELLVKLDGASHAITTLSGEFTQHNKLKLFKKEIVSQGRILFRRPGQIRWEYLTPDPSKMILDGDTATISTPGATPQVFNLAKDPAMRTIFDQILLWIAPQAIQTAAATYDLSTTDDKLGPTLVLTPKPESPVARAFHRIELTVERRSYLMKRLRLVEKNGDEKEILFTKLKPNAPLLPDAFK
jgi:outer membrane lipoprotein-sorting protein